MSADPLHDRILSPVQAALHLGITPELLFGYTGTAFANSSGLASLMTVESDGSTFFRASDLDEFDRRLAGPWVDEGAPRIAVPKCIADHLHAESLNQCSRCGSGIDVETAHIERWESSRSHHPNNLIRICSRCHGEHDRHQSLPSPQLRQIKNRLVERMRAMISMRARPIPPHPTP